MISDKNKKISLITIVLIGLVISNVQQQFETGYLDNNIDVEKNSLNYHSKLESISKNTGIQALPTHGTITIDGNANFTTDGEWTGSGTQTDPYLFKDAFINTNGESGIQITNTDAYFRIENVWINGSTDNLVGGFELVNVYNGQLINNTVSNSHFGFHLTASIGFSTNNSWINNSASNNIFRGFYLTGASNNTLHQNIATNNGQEGYFLDRSSNNTLTFNNATKNTLGGFRVSDSDHNLLSHNTAVDSGFLPGVATTYSGFILSGDNNIVSNNVAINSTGDGFYLGSIFFSSNNNNFSYNTASNNAQNGFHIGFDTFGIINKITDVNNLTLSYNTAFNNGRDGFNIVGNNSFILTNNTAFNNGLSGFRFVGYMPVITGELTETKVEWLVTDLNPGTYLIYQNGVEVDSGQLRTVSLGSRWQIIDYNIFNLSPMAYNFTIMIIDTSGNMATDTILFTVPELPVPITITITNTVSQVTNGFEVLIIIFSFVIIIGYRKWR